MKSILISIQPQWVEKILNGEKTIEIRKTRPKCDLPCKVYIYCIKGQELWGDGTGETWKGIDKNEDMELVHELNPTLTRLNGKVVAEFTLNVVEDFECASDDFRYLVENTKCCLTMQEVLDYCKGNDLYGWHIDNLEIYDKPKELSEFTHYIPNNKCPKMECGIDCEDCMSYDGEHETCLALYYLHRQIKRPPQSYMFVEEIKKEQLDNHS